MISRRNLIMAATLPLITSAFGPAPGASAAELGDNGLHIQDWFLDSFLDLAEDRIDAADNGKVLAVLFEQRGCPYCREMHNVNLAREEITSYIKANFEVLQLDMWGSRTVTDFDGEELAEKQLARKWRVNFTPTIVFIRPGSAEAAPQDMEVARMPGYFKPFHFITMFEFVKQEKFNEETVSAFPAGKIQGDGSQRHQARPLVNDFTPPVGRPGVTGPRGTGHRRRLNLCPRLPSGL